MQATTTRQVVQQYEQELVRLRFKETTIRIYREFWTSFVRFCDGGNEEAFSAETAFRFLYEGYGIVDTTSPNQLTRHQQHLRQMVRKLIHFHGHGYLEQDLSAAVPRQQERRDTTGTAVWSQADV